MEKTASKLLGARSRVSNLRKALKTILAILSPGLCKENRCQGCDAEVRMAIREAKEALKKDQAS